MQLQEFISETLVAIHKGVTMANDSIGRDGGRPYYVIDSASNHKDRSDGYIKFDVAVTASNATDKKAGAGINVLSVSLGGGVDTSVTDQTVSRIKFGIAPNLTTG